MLWWLFDDTTVLHFLIMFYFSIQWRWLCFQWLSYVSSISSWWSSSEQALVQNSLYCWRLWMGLMLLTHFQPWLINLILIVKLQTINTQSLFQREQIELLSLLQMMSLSHLPLLQIFYYHQCLFFEPDDAPFVSGDDSFSDSYNVNELGPEHLCQSKLIREYRFSYVRSSNQIHLYLWTQKIQFTLQDSHARN